LSSHGSSQQVGRSVDNDAFNADISSLKDSHIRNYGPHSKEFLWLGPPTCQRSFCRNGITISFDNDDITDFDITQVQGYWRQEVLRYMYTISKHLESHDVDEDAMKTRPKKEQCRSKSKEIDR
ncbi:hypothetical protein FRX31_029951, partial [Thalictrum thalictroides]